MLNYFICTTSRNFNESPMSHETTTPPRTVQQLIGQMTVSELCSSVRRVLESGRLGTPVNVRLHWEFSESEASLPAIATTAVAIADVALQLQQPAWRIRRHSCGRTLNILGSDQQGRTLMISLVAKSSPQTAMTIFGNHGVVRLEDGWVDPKSASEPSGDCQWACTLNAAIAG